MSEAVEIIYECSHCHRRESSLDSDQIGWRCGIKLYLPPHLEAQLGTAICDGLMEKVPGERWYRIKLSVRRRKLSNLTPSDPEVQWSDRGRIRIVVPAVNGSGQPTDGKPQIMLLPFTRNAKEIASMLIDAWHEVKRDNEEQFEEVAS